MPAAFWVRHGKQLTVTDVQGPELKQERRAMASANSVQGQPPEKFDFASQNERSQWERKFKRFRVISGLSNKPQSEKINALIYFMGGKANDNIIPLNFNPAKMQNYVKVLSPFERHTD